MKSINLQNQKILVSGGAGVGVAAGIVQALHECGAYLIVIDNHEESLNKLAKKYPSIETHNKDITDNKAMGHLFRTIKDHHGTIQGLVNNAGVGLSKVSNEATEEDFGHLFGVNVEAMWRLSKAFANQCIENNSHGNIVNISSVHAHSTANRYAIYSSSKHAVVGLTLGMAVELGPKGIRVNAVGPGYVHADQNYDLIKTWADDPQKWVEELFTNQQAITSEIKPIDVGHTVAFLLSDLARCITGQNIYVDNGTTSLIFNRDFT